MHPILIKALDPIFGHPRGALGKLGGAVMVRGNEPQERWAVEKASLRHGEQVLVIGPGPGVGLALAPEGRVVAVDPSVTMRRMAAARCAAHLQAGHAEIREGTSERTGCSEASIDTVISVNNVTMWDRPASFKELLRVVRLGGRLVIVAHRHILDTTPDELRADTVAGGFADVALDVRGRSLKRAVIGITAQRPSS